MSKTTSLTIAEKNEKMTELARYSLDALQGMTLDQLKTLARGIIQCFSKMRKKELIEKLVSASEQYTLARNAELTEKVMDSGEITLSDRYLDKLAQSGIDAVEASQHLLAKMETERYSPKTLVKTKSKQLRNALAKLVLLDPKLDTWTTAVYREWLKSIKPLSDAVNAEYETKKDHRKPDQFMRVDGDRVLGWAKDVLSLENVTWHKLSFALALTSGRRMAEIHGSTQYELVGEQILAKGLVKKKTDDYEFLFKPLVPADLWFEALNRLPENRRNVPHHTIHGTVRKAIADAMGSKINELGFKSFKDSRDFYISYHLDRHYDRQIHASEPQYIMQLIGHDNTKSSGSYTKMYTT